MKVLGIETATAIGSVALVDLDADGEGLRVESRLSTPAGHAERLMVLIERLLREQGVQLEDIAGFAVSIGPGSFTGLKVGLATVKGLARACPRPTTPVSTLEALAWQVREPGRLICSVMDARQEEVFAAIYRWTTGGAAVLVCVMPPTVMKPEALGDLITEPTVFVGTGVERYRSLWEDHGAWGTLAPDSVVCSATAVAELGALQLRRGEGQAAVGLVPVYLRRSMAEETQRRARAR